MHKCKTNALMVCKLKIPKTKIRKRKYEVSVKEEVRNLLEPALSFEALA